MSSRRQGAIRRRADRPISVSRPRRPPLAGGKGRVGDPLPASGGATMNDDDYDGLLFSVDDLERWKRRELPPSWLDDQAAVLIARSKAQSAQFQKLLATADPATVSRLKNPLCR